MICQSQIKLQLGQIKIFYVDAQRIIKLNWNEKILYLHFQFDGHPVIARSEESVIPEKKKNKLVMEIQHLLLICLHHNRKIIKIACGTLWVQST